jgi:hypothetical protein
VLRLSRSLAPRCLKLFEDAQELLIVVARCLGATTAAAAAIGGAASMLGGGRVQRHRLRLRHRVSAVDAVLAAAVLGPVLALVLIAARFGPGMAVLKLPQRAGSGPRLVARCAR